MIERAREAGEAFCLAVRKGGGRAQGARLWPDASLTEIGDGLYRAERRVRHPGHTRTSAPPAAPPQAHPPGANARGGGHLEPQPRKPGGCHREGGAAGWPGAAR